MRIDSCRKCGMPQKEYADTERCHSCGRTVVQFVCAKCQIVTEPQYHMHGKIREALQIVI